ncbi:MAG: DNA primase [Spirochaetales bacterium]|nr:DNA primase [Spirochaetales bacterium]
MRITKESIEKIRSSINLSDVVSMYVKVQKVGSRFRALCPFHNEKTPSFYIDDNKGLFHCFGCKAAGDIFSFVMKIENCDFYEAALKIANLANVSVEYEKGSFDDEKPDLIKNIFSEVTLFYNQNLKRNKSALSYLQNRKIKDFIIEKYKLGWASKSDLPFFDNLKKKYKLDNEILFQLGLLKKGDNSFYPFFYERLIIPIQNHYLEYVAFGGRTLNEEYGPKYLNSPEHQLFKKGNLLFNFAYARMEKENNKIIIVEGYFDVLSLVQIGINYVVAPLGTALTSYHLQILSRKFSQLYLLFDMDEAGRKATLSSIEIAIKFFSEIYVINLPKGIKDIDQFIKEKNVEKESFEKYITENSISGIDLIITNKLYLDKEKRDINKAYKNFIYFLHSLNDNILSSTLIKRAAYLDGTFSEDQIVNMYSSRKINDINDKILEKSKVEKNPQDKNYGEIKKLEMEFVGFIINNEDFINITRQYIKPDSFISSEASDFYKKALTSLNYKDRNMFLRNELTEEEANYMYNPSIKDYKDIQSVFEDYLSFFKLRELEKELEIINKEIKKAELNKFNTSELLEKKQFLISSIQRLKEFRKKIYKNE